MSRVTIAVDLSKHVFEVAVSESPGRITERRRLSRSHFERFWNTRPPCRVVLEACATSHYWGRRLRAVGFEVVLIPPQYMRPYVRRNRPIEPTARHSWRRSAVPGSSRSR